MTAIRFITQRTTQRDVLSQVCRPSVGSQCKALVPCLKCVPAGRGASDSGFWDAYRTVYPLNSLLHTKQWGLQMEGWLNAFKEGGWLPSWSAPGDRGAMTGNMQDASIADAIVKRKWLPETFNASLAWDAVAKDAYTIDSKGRKGLALYEKYLFRLGGCS